MVYNQGSKQTKLSPGFLDKYLQIIQSSFPVEHLLKEKIGTKDISRYYSINYWPYRLFHDWCGYRHMGLSFDGHYQKKDLEASLQVIESWIQRTKALKVLELGAGIGANSLFLARRNRQASFVGVDLSPPHSHEGCQNYEQVTEDFHDLSRFEAESFDLVFVIESLCHSPNKGKVLAQVHRVLKPGGVFLIFDGYLKKPLTNLSDSQSTALNMTAKAMSVERAELLEDFESTFRPLGFELLEQQDLSQAVLPTMYRLQKIALWFYYFPPLTKLLCCALPFDFVKNSVAGLLMPFLIEEGISGYYLHVLKKKP